MPRYARTLLILFTLMLISAPLAPDAATGHMSKQQACELLKQGNNPAVRALPAGEREILLAKLALDAGRTEEAIRVLSSSAVAGNPLAALIRAEAYRRQSVAAARRAGHYAHAVTGNIGKLQKARLSVGLNQAETRLQAFMAGRQLAAAAPQRSLAHPQPVHRTPSKHQPATPTRSNRSQLPTSLLASIEAWRRDWESRNADAYLSHYHPAFRSAKGDFRSWSAYKQRVNARKTYIHVKISDLRLRRGPEQVAEGEAVLVTFRQQYQSSNYAANSRKQLYLVRKHADDGWLILFEGDASPLYRHRTTARASQSIRPNNQALRSSGAWAINIGSFDSAANARQMATSIHIAGPQQPFISSASVGGKAVHRVRIGLYASRNKAVDAMLKICPKLGLSDCWLEQAK